MNEYHAVMTTWQEDKQPLPCIVCKKQLKASIGEWTQPHGGVTLADQAAYGSRFDEESIMLTVCDDCLAENRSIIRSWRNIRTQPILQVGQFAPWLDSQSGNVREGD